MDTFLAVAMNPNPQKIVPHLRDHSPPRRSGATHSWLPSETGSQPSQSSTGHTQFVPSGQPTPKRCRISLKSSGSGYKTSSTLTSPSVPTIEESEASPDGSNSGVDDGIASPDPLLAEKLKAAGIANVMGSDSGDSGNDDPDDDDLMDMAQWLHTGFRPQ